MEIKQLYILVLLLKAGHKVDPAIFDIRPRIRPPASPTKLARATISRTVVVLKMIKGDRLHNHSQSD